MTGGIALIHWLLTAFAYVLALRFLLQAVQADFYNPLSQYIVKFSEPVCGPLRKLIPARGRLDLASLLLLFFIHFAFWFVVVSQSAQAAPITAIFARSGFDVVSIFLNAYFAALIIMVVMSWLTMANPALGQQPIWPIVNMLIEPVAAPLRRIIPPIGGLDLSVIVLFLGIQFAKMLNIQFWSLWL